MVRGNRMLINRKEPGRKKGWFEQWLDITFVEKLVSLAWC